MGFDFSFGGSVTLRVGEMKFPFNHDPVVLGYSIKGNKLPAALSKTLE